MVRISWILILFFVLSGCKTEKVEFAQAEQEVFTPPPTGSGDDEVPQIQPPVVQITQKPKNHFLGEHTEVRYEVYEGDFPVENLQCSVNGWPLPCLLTSILMPLTGFDLGTHKFEIVVKDSEGYEGFDSAQWLVSNRFYSVNEDIDVSSGNKADILFVIDNSISMEEEQKEMGRRISKFFSKVKDLDWKVAIATTDPYWLHPGTGLPTSYADGALLRFPNGSYWLDSNLSLVEAEFQFSKTIQRDERGNGHERGIRNTYRSVQRSLTPGDSPENQRLNDFFRDKASFSVVLISDENETTRNVVDALLPEQHMSVGSNLVEYIRQVWGPQKKFQFNSVIVRPGDANCLGEYEQYGTAYANLSNMTGGEIEDICAPDYTGALRKIGAGVVNLQKVYTLKCEPVDTNGNGRLNFEVIRLQGVGSIPSYEIRANSIEFQSPLRYGKYQFKYSCLEPVSI